MGKDNVVDLSHNAVALAAVRDLQTQQNLRLGAPLATKSVLLIKAILKVTTNFCPSLFIDGKHLYRLTPSQCHPRHRNL